jgi:hypothetical protein
MEIPLFHTFIVYRISAAQLRLPDTHSLALRDVIPYMCSIQRRYVVNCTIRD